MNAPKDEKQTFDGRATQKQRRRDFEETDVFNTLEVREHQPPPPPGSLAAWLAKNQAQAASEELASPKPERGNEGAAARPASYSDPDKWWICCDPLPPIPLTKDTAEITIGRADSCDVVLPHTQVSRVHGVIRVEGPQIYMYEDSGSSNGSTLNGDRVPVAKLKVGDVLGVGPYEIEVHSSETLQQRGKKQEQEEGGDLTRVMETLPKAAMTGRLNEIPISEILQSLEFNCKTGTLEIQAKAGRGTLTVAEGHPIAASFNDLQDDEAVVAMAGLLEGRFQFSGHVEPGEPTVRSTITRLLLDAARRRDEGK